LNLFTAIRHLWFRPG